MTMEHIHGQRGHTGYACFAAPLILVDMLPREHKIPVDIHGLVVHQGLGVQINCVTSMFEQGEALNSL